MTVGNGHPPRRRWGERHGPGPNCLSLVVGWLLLVVLCGFVVFVLLGGAT